MTAPNRNKQDASAGQARMHPAFFIGGLLLILIAALSSGMLTYAHLSGKSIPGCGVGSGCAALSNGPFGKIPLGGFAWPVSYLGLAYFAALIPGWVVSRGGIAPALRWLLRIGALASVGFTGIMMKENHFCQYCFAAHLANLTLLVVAELSGKPAVRSVGPLPVVASFFLISLILGMVDMAVSREVKEEQKAKHKESTEEIIRKSAATDDTPLPAPNYDWGPNGFTGRYRLGPENAAIRVVIYADYQCVDCRRIEGEIIQIFNERNDMSVSMKHCPFDQKCNDYLNTSPHLNACWAARAAEAAGILRGNEGFWRMHEWLFSQDGAFTGDNLPDALTQMGYNPSEFIFQMSSQQTMDLVRRDVDESYALGLYFTPMIFINGVQLKGWTLPNAVRTTIEAVAATNPPFRTPHYDNPPLALEKYIADWREERLVTLPPVDAVKLYGNDDAPIAIRLWGDAQDPNTQEVYTEIRRLLSEHDDISFAYYNFPMSGACNSMFTRPDTPYAFSCRAAQAAEAGAIAGGREGFWAMLDWIMAHPNEVDDDNTLRLAAAQRGLNPESYIQALSSPEVDNQIARSIAYARNNFVSQVPWLYVNGRRLIHRKLSDRLILDKIVEQARQNP